MVIEELRARFFEELDRQQGNISATARAVGVSRNTAFGWARSAGIRGRGKTGTGAHPRRGEYDELRAGGMPRREAATRVGVNVRTARDWDHGVRKIGNARLYPDGRRIDYKTGVSTFTTAGIDPSLRQVEAVLDPRFLTILDRETIADMRRRDASLREIGRALGRPASTGQVPWCGVIPAVAWGG